MSSDGNPQARKTLIRALITIAALPLLVPIVLLVLTFAALYCVYGALLHVLVWLVWCPGRERVLFVYSNSPNWQEYIERHIIPRLPHNTQLLNLSERRHWRDFSLSVLLFRYFGGWKEFNPMAVVFRRFRWGRAFRFYKPFLAYKHGNADPLRKVEREFFAFLSPPPRATAI